MAKGITELIADFKELHPCAYKRIRDTAIDEFTHQLKENLNQEFPRNYESTRPYLSLENARLIVDDVAEQMRKEV